MAEKEGTENKQEQPKQQQLKRFEYREVDLGEVIGLYISHLPNPEEWQVPAIDVITKCVILRREVKEVVKP